MGVSFRNGICETYRKSIVMNNKPVSPQTHGIVDYALAGSLLVLPSIFGFSKKVKTLYAAEAVILLTYVALSDHPAAVKPVIPFTTHGKIDPYNVTQFALQSFLNPFRKSKKALLFNIGFTALAGITVALTDWSGKTSSRAR